MNLLNQVDHIQPISSPKLQDQNESLLNESGRLIHAAVISKRFLNTLLSDPIRSIEAGFCGEKFAFTHEEKQQIRHIQASSLAEFSKQLLQVVTGSCCISTTTEMAYARLEAQ